MNSKRQFGLFLISFVVIFILFRGIAILLANADWTLVMLLICAVVVIASALAWSLIRNTNFATSFRAIGFGIPNGRARSRHHISIADGGIYSHLCRCNKSGYPPSG